MDQRIDLYRAEEQARRDECAGLIVDCFNNIKARLDELGAWVMFVQFAKATLPEPSGIRRNSDFDEQILAAYDSAADGAKPGAAIQIGARFRKTSEFTLRRLARLLAQRASGSLSAEQLRLAFGLDPLLKIKQAQDQFEQLSKDQELGAANQTSSIFGAFLTDGAIGIPPLPHRSLPIEKMKTPASAESGANPSPILFHEPIA